MAASLPFVSVHEVVLEIGPAHEDVFLCLIPGDPSVAMVPIANRRSPVGNSQSTTRDLNLYDVSEQCALVRHEHFTKRGQEVLSVCIFGEDRLLAVFAHRSLTTIRPPRTIPPRTSLVDVPLRPSNGWLRSAPIAIKRAASRHICPCQLTIVSPWDRNWGGRYGTSLSAQCTPVSRSTAQLQPGWGEHVGWRAWRHHDVRPAGYIRERWFAGIGNFIPDAFRHAGAHASSARTSLPLAAAEYAARTHTGARRRIDPWYDGRDQKR